jgi:hypothetical protein
VTEEAPIATTNQEEDEISESSQNLEEQEEPATTPTYDPVIVRKTQNSVNDPSVRAFLQQVDMSIVISPHARERALNFRRRTNKVNLNLSTLPEEYKLFSTITLDQI